MPSGLSNKFINIENLLKKIITKMFKINKIAKITLFFDNNENLIKMLTENKKIQKASY